GLAANEDTIYHTDGGTLETAWKAAAEQGVIPQTRTREIPELVKKFQALSAQKMLTGLALIGTSSLKEMLVVSGLNEGQQKQFAEIYAAHRTDMTAFWNAAKDAFGSDMTKRLQVDGKLAFLTINSAPLVRALHIAVGDNGVSDPLQLAQMGYHRASKWR